MLHDGGIARVQSSSRVQRALVWNQLVVSSWVRLGNRIVVHGKMESTGGTCSLLLSAASDNACSIGASVPLCQESDYEAWRFSEDFGSRSSYPEVGLKGVGLVGAQMDLSLNPCIPLQSQVLTEGA